MNPLLDPRRNPLVSLAAEVPANLTPSQRRAWLRFAESFDGLGLVRRSDLLAVWLLSVVQAEVDDIDAGDRAASAEYRAALGEELAAMLEKFRVEPERLS